MQLTLWETERVSLVVRKTETFLNVNIRLFFERKFYFIFYFVFHYFVKTNKKKMASYIDIGFENVFLRGVLFGGWQSRTRDCKQIHEIKQNRFLYGMQLVFCEFLTKASKFGFWVSARYSSSNSSTPRTFLKFPKIIKFGNSQLLHSLSGDNNLVPFHLWWREIVLRM